jgi:hypothetical protein
MNPQDFPALRNRFALLVQYIKYHSPFKRPNRNYRTKNNCDFGLMVF